MAPWLYDRVTPFGGVAAYAPQGNLDAPPLRPGDPLPDRWAARQSGGPDYSDSSTPGQAATSRRWTGVRSIILEKIDLEGPPGQALPR